MWFDPSLPLLCGSLRRAPLAATPGKIRLTRPRGSSRFVAYGCERSTIAPRPLLFVTPRRAFRRPAKCTALSSRVAGMKPLAEARKRQVILSSQQSIHISSNPLIRIVTNFTSKFQPLAHPARTRGWSPFEQVQCRCTASLAILGVRRLRARQTPWQGLAAMPGKKRRRTRAPRYLTVNLRLLRFPRGGLETMQASKP